jgi:guanylate kinase
LSERTPNVVVVSAPSGAGKSTVLERTLRNMTGIRFSVSHTTRAPRPGEAEGVQYHFVGRDLFETLKGNLGFLEWAEVHGHLYGTSQAEYEQARRKGEDLLLDLDVQGAASVRKVFKDAVTVFILPPSYRDLETRIRRRGQDDEATIRRRLEVARAEMSLYGDYDYALVNDDVDRCVRALTSVIEASRSRTARMTSVADAILQTFPKEK